MQCKFGLSEALEAPAVETKKQEPVTAASCKPSVAAMSGWIGWPSALKKPAHEARVEGGDVAKALGRFPGDPANTQNKFSAPLGPTHF